MKNMWYRLPEKVRRIIEGNAIFLAVSVIASLSFTSIASFLTLAGAVVAGFYVAFMMNRREMQFAAVSTIISSLLLQILYFSTASEFMSMQAVIVLTIGNLIIITLLSLLGGLIALGIRKHKEHKEGIQKEVQLRKENTYWVDRLLPSIVLIFYVSVFVLPLSPVYSKEKQTVDEFFDNYDSDRKYQPAAEAVVPTLLPSKMETQEQEEADLQYYAIEELRGTPIGIGDYFVLTFQGVTLGIFKWKEPNRIRREYMEGVYGRTGNVVAEIASAAGWAYKNPQVAWQNVQNGGKSALNVVASLANILGTVQVDSRAYYADAHNKLYKGDIKQLLKILNPFAGVKHSLDSRYPGGAGGFMKDTFSQKTAENVAGVFVSKETINMAKQGELRYALSRGAGEIAGDIITLKVTGKVLKVVPLIGNIIIDYGKSLKWGSEFKTGKFITSNGISLDKKALHLLERSSERNVSQADVLKTLKEPEATGKIKVNPDTRERSVPFISKNTFVAVNPDNGKIVTTWKLNEKGFERYYKKFKNEK